MWNPHDSLSSQIDGELFGGDGEDSGPENGSNDDNEDFSEDDELPLQPEVLLTTEPGLSSDEEESGLGASLQHSSQIRRSRGRGHTRGRKAPMRGRCPRAGVRGWRRAEPLQQRFLDDSELPDEIRITAQRMIADRIKRTDTECIQPTDVEKGEFDSSEEFVWRSMGDWDGRKESFSQTNTGPTQDCSDLYQTFRIIWNDEILNHIASSTNDFAKTQNSDFLNDWYDTNIDEIMLLFAFWMMLGIIQMPTTQSCFSKMPLLKTDAFRNLFSEARYNKLNKAFRLVKTDNEVDDNNDLNQMGPVLKHLNDKFRSLYMLNQNICINECPLIEGHLIKRFKDKISQIGYITYQLCESMTGYLWSFYINVGQKVPSQSIVVKLTQPVLNKGHVLFLNDIFNSPRLARFLKKKKTDCVGSLRTNLGDVSYEILKAPLSEGELIARHSGDVMILSLQDRKRMHLLSTYHDLSQEQLELNPGRPFFRLNLIKDYNDGMCGVERSDTTFEPYMSEKKHSLKWAKHLFKKLLNVSVQNTRILFLQSTGRNEDALTFRLMLVQEITNHHLKQTLKEKPVRVPISDDRLSGRHFIQRMQITDEMRAKITHRSNLGRKTCVLCTHKNKKTTVYECDTCKVPLCLDGCFKSYHTVP